MDSCDKQTDFTFSSGTEVEGSCSVVWRDEMFVFGGNNQNHQISKVESCRLTLVGQLSMKANKPACTNVGDELIFICFHDKSDPSTDQKCFKAAEPLAEPVAARDSTYNHGNTRIGNDGGKVDSKGGNSL